MKFRIENRYRDASKYLIPPCVPMPREKFIASLVVGIPHVVPKEEGAVTKVYESHVRIAKLYLEKYGINELVPDETFFQTMWKRLKIGGEANGDLGPKKYSSATTQRAVRGIREIVNRYFFSEGIISRPILLEVEWNRYQRFFALTPQSQKAVVWFEENGRIVKAFPVLIVNGNGGETHSEGSPIRYVPRIVDKKLLPYTNYQKIQQAFRFLESIGKNGFELVTDEDVEKFKEELERRNLKKKNDYLADIATFFINIQSAGFVSANPFREISLKKDASSVRIDYIPQAGIDRLYDLSNLDMKDPVEVRNRLITFFCYDTALRIAEAASLRLSDLRKDTDGEWSLLLRSESQKGREKPPLTMYFYFEKTKKLLNHYLTKIRPQLRPLDDSLFLSTHSRKAVMLQPCRKAIADHLAKYGIKTFYGKRATAHHLRHSFGTLNIEPLGLSLPAHEISYRYRHTRLEITLRIYVHNNPELIKQKHREIQKKHKRSYGEMLDSIPLAELEHWLSDRLGILPETLRAIRRKHHEAFSTKKASEPMSVPTPNGSNGKIDSSRVREIAESKGIPFRSLKRYCRKKRLLSKIGRSYRFDSAFIGDLEENWFPANEVMRKLKIPLGSFYHVIRERKWQTLKLGKTLLISAGRLNLLK